MCTQREVDSEFNKDHLERELFYSARLGGILKGLKEISSVVNYVPAVLAPRKEVHEITTWKLFGSLKESVRPGAQN
jgi:hypothetical protein